MENIIKAENNSNTITTLEIAEMIGVRHKEILRKIDGGNDRKGYSQILTENQMVLSDYFISSTYNDNSGKSNKCYNVTKLGCDFLANKFTGEKGILFTAKYVKKFHDMEKIVLSNENRKATLLLSIYNGGQEGVIAAKKLTDIEVEKATAPLLETLDSQKPLVEFATHVTESSDTVDIGEFSKIVNTEHINIGRNKLFLWLRENKYLMKNNSPYQKYINNGYFKVIETEKKTVYGTKLFSKTLITGKGQINLVERLRKEFGVV